MVNLWHELIAAATLVCILEVEDYSGILTINRSIVFFRAFNAILSKVGRTASEETIIYSSLFRPTGSSKQ